MWALFWFPFIDGIGASVAFPENEKCMHCRINSDMVMQSVCAEAGEFQCLDFRNGVYAEDQPVLTDASGKPNPTYFCRDCCETLLDSQEYQKHCDADIGYIGVIPKEAPPLPDPSPFPKHDKKQPSANSFAERPPPIPSPPPFTQPEPEDRSIWSRYMANTQKQLSNSSYSPGLAYDLRRVSEAKMRTKERKKLGLFTPPVPTVTKFDQKRNQPRAKKAIGPAKAPMDRHLIPDLHTIATRNDREEFVSKYDADETSGAISKMLDAVNDAADAVQNGINSLLDPDDPQQTHDEPEDDAASVLPALMSTDHGIGGADMLGGISVAG